MKRIVTFAALVTLGCAFTPAQASIYNFDFADVNGSWSISDPGAGTSASLGVVSDTYTLTASGLSITATIFPGSNPVQNLYVKGTNQGSTEQGLGTTADGDHEITNGYYIQLDLTNVISGLNAAPIISATLQTNSVQPPDAWELDGTNVSGIGSLNSLATGGTPQTIDLTPYLPGGASTQYSFFSLTQTDTTAGDSNVVLGALIITTQDTATPEPASFLLSGAALLALGLISRKATAAWRASN